MDNHIEQKIAEASSEYVEGAGSGAVKVCKEARARGARFGSSIATRGLQEHAGLREAGQKSAVEQLTVLLSLVAEEAEEVAEDTAAADLD